MKENITYSECLAKILQALDLKSSRLAREINIDSSLIYKWLRNERVPSSESPYIELILKCIEKRLTNSFQKKAVIDVLTDYGIELSETGDTYILNHLRLILQDSQGYSIRLRNKMKSKHKLFSYGISTGAGSIEKMDTEEGRSGNDDDSINGCYDSATKTRNLFCGRDHIQIIKDILKILYSAISLLKQSPETPCSDSNTILLTFNSDIKLLLESKDINNIWTQTLYDLLSSGWNIIFKINLDSNANRTIKIIEYIQALLTAGNLTVYYDRKPADFSSDTELCIVPQTGALFSFSTNARNQIDSAFLFRSKKSIEMLTERFFNDLNSAKPLLRSYPPQESAEFQHVFAESEEIPGDKYVFKSGLSTVTIPLDLYERYLRLSNRSNQEILHRMFLHKRRLDAFYAQIKYYKFKDICFIESLDKLIDKRTYSPDENYILSNNIPDDKDIIRHLEHVIDLLKKHDNYDIAFVKQKQFTRITAINWMVKSKDSVLVESFKSASPNVDSPHSEMNFVITEKGVVNAFHDHFLTLWDSIPDKSKDKKSSIARLRSLIKKCGSCTNHIEIDQKGIGNRK